MVTGNPEIDFFKQNPELRYLSPIKNIIDKYSESEASKILWAIYLLEDIGSKFYRLPRIERLSEIRKHYYDIDEKEFEELIAVYPMLVGYSKEQRLYKIQADKLDELTIHLRGLKIEKDFEKVLKIQEKMPKIWEGYDRIYKKMIEVQTKDVVRAGAMESAREKRGKQSKHG